MQLALAEAIPTYKKTSGALLNALGTIAYKAVKKEGEFVLPGFGKSCSERNAPHTWVSILRSGRRSRWQPRPW